MEGIIDQETTQKRIATTRRSDPLRSCHTSLEQKNPVRCRQQGRTAWFAPATFTRRRIARRPTGTVDETTEFRDKCFAFVRVDGPDSSGQTPWLSPSQYIHYQTRVRSNPPMPSNPFKGKIWIVSIIQYHLDWPRGFQRWLRQARSMWLRRS